jgi:ABC-type transporter Mla MlaB component
LDVAAPTPSSIVFAVGGSIGRADVPRLCTALRALLEGSDAKLVVCDVRALVDPDATAVEALARLQLTARRLGCRIRLRHASSELRALIGFMGLRAAMCSGSTRGRRPRPSRG